MWKDNMPVRTHNMLVQLQDLVPVGCRVLLYILGSVPCPFSSTHTLWRTLTLVVLNSKEHYESVLKPRS